MCSLTLPSYAHAKADLEIAWNDVENAVEPEALTDAYSRWFAARQVLREILIEAGAA